MAIFKLPEYLLVLDKLPTMPSGKTDLKAVRQQVIDSIAPAEA